MKFAQCNCTAPDNPPGILDGPDTVTINGVELETVRRVHICSKCGRVAVSNEIRTDDLDMAHRVAEKSRQDARLADSMTVEQLLQLLLEREAERRKTRWT